MKQVQMKLALVMAVPLVVSLLMVVLFESDMLPCGFISGCSGSGEFMATMVMELLTLCVIPVALRLFKFARVAAALASGGLGALGRWGTLRLLLLCVPLMVNTLLYYMYMNVAFGYMGIILLLCLAFVAPTRARCEQEVDGGAQR